MYIEVELKSKKEIEENWDRVVAAFVSLAEDLYAEKMASQKQGSSKKKTGGKTKVMVSGPAYPTVCHERNP
jgi:hypothetical protein